MNLNAGPKIALSANFELDQVIILKISQDSLFFHPKKCYALKTECYHMVISDYNGY